MRSILAHLARLKRYNPVTMMNLAQALRWLPPPALETLPAPASREAASSLSLALVGAGGKTTALFQLARQLTARRYANVLVATTTHFGVWQAAEADRHLVAAQRADLAALEDGPPAGVTLVSGPPVGDRLGGLCPEVLSWLHEICRKYAAPLLIEADGGRGRPLKAPADHEPALPPFIETVVVAAGLSGLGQPLTDEHVHRPEIFARLSGIEMGDVVTPEALARLLTRPEGGLKDIPASARRVVLLNQADSPALQAAGGQMASALLENYQSVILAALLEGKVFSVGEKIAGIVLAAGESKRFGQPKQLLEWRGKPFVRQAAETALAAGLQPVVVVTGAHAEQVAASLTDLAVTVRHNPAWPSGQSSSLQAGLAALPPEAGGAVFLLADQPQVPPTLLRALVERHCRDLCPILAPQVRGQRANPVLFDRLTFPALQALRGDIGGRALFAAFPVAYLPWHDESLLIDVDRPSDLEHLS